MNNQFLIPANAKKSMLIFGLFNTMDLILFCVGVGVSLILLIALPVEELMYAIIALAPALIIGFLVFPIPNYHNTLTFLIGVYTFITSRQKFIWKGWCLDHEEEK